MIIVKLMGGLGNQMFQYAAGKALSIHLGTELLIDRSFLDAEFENTTKRNFELDIFAISEKIIDNNYITRNFRFDHSRRSKLISLITGKKLIHEYIENQFNFNERFFELLDKTLLIGYFQSEKYFASSSKLIKNIYSFPDIKNSNINEYSEKIKSCEAVSIHIRRGDYVKNSTIANFHGTCSPEYYENAVEEIINRVKNPVAFIFSDDMDWVKNNFTSKIPYHYINLQGHADFTDMYLMSLCKHHIIANSSFSWWGAWLGSNPAKTVIAPLKWFNDTSKNTSDLIPASWLRI